MLDMKLDKSKILLINTVVGLVGLILVLISITTENNPKMRVLLEAVGTGLIASGGVNFLDKLFTQETSENDMSKLIKILDTQRSKIDSSIHEKKYSATKVDIVGINLNNCLKEIVDDPRQRMIKHIFSGKAERLRLLLVNPNAPFIKQRALEDNMSEVELKRRQQDSIKICISFYKKLREKRQDAIKKDEFNGTSYVEIRLIDFCPHITIERIDDESYWGLYTSDTIGINSPMFKACKNENDALFEQLKKHFIGLRTKSLNNLEDNILLRMTIDELFFNKPLAQSSLDFNEDQLKDLLKYC